MVREFFPLLEFLLESNNHSGGVWRLLSYVPDGFPVEMYGTIHVGLEIKTHKE